MMDLHLADTLSRGLHSLNALPAAQLSASLQALLRPPSLEALPLSAQANLFLLLRAAPHRFSAAQRAALLEGLVTLAAAHTSSSDPQHASLLQLLAEEPGGTTTGPACPTFLYTPQPCFPWAPVRTDAAAAAALHKQQQAAARRQQQQQAAAAADDAAGSKRPAGGGSHELEPDGRTAKRQRPEATASTQQAMSAAAAANAELDAAVAAVKAALASPAPLTTVPPQLREALDVLLMHASAGTPAGTEALQEAGLGTLRDDGTLLLLLTELVTPASSFARCSAAAAGLLLPRLQALEAPASRDLAAAVEHVGAANPQAFISACLCPLLSGPGLNKHQGELLSGALKAGLPPALLPDVLAATCAPPPGVGVSVGSGWNEHTVGVLQAVLNARPLLGAAGVAQLAGAFVAAMSSTAELATSPKYAKLVLSVVKQYSVEAAGAKVQLQAAAAACRSFMAKSLLAAVAKL